MPQCPRCGGAGASKIAPGYYQCTCNNSDGYSCGNRYRIKEEMIQTPLCDCGTFSIGQCSECKKYVCGIHSGLYNGNRLCDADYEAAEQKTKEALEEAHEAKWEVVTGQMRRFLAAMSQAGNPGMQSFPVGIDMRYRKDVWYSNNRKWWQLPIIDSRELVSGWIFGHYFTGGGRGSGGHKTDHCLVLLPNGTFRVLEKSWSEKEQFLEKYSVGLDSFRQGIYVTAEVFHCWIENLCKEHGIELSEVFDKK